MDEKQHLRHCILFAFQMGKNGAEAHDLINSTLGENSVSLSTIKKWFAKFRSGNFSLEDSPRPGAEKKFEDEQLESLLNENPAQTLKELAEILDVNESTVSRRLHAMGKIQKEGKWLPHELSETAISNRFNIAFSLLARQEKKSFLWRIVTGDEKWVYYDNPKRKKSWVSPGQPSIATPKRNIHGQKVLLCIWWDQQGVVYYELLKPNETVTGEHYKQQLQRLSENLVQKRPAIASNRRKVILLHDNARPHVSKVVKDTLLNLKWEILPHPAYSPDMAPSDYHLFRSMQHALADTHFRKPEEVKKWIDEWITSKPRSFFHDGISKLPERWRKCIASEGKYFD